MITYARVLHSCNGKWSTKEHLAPGWEKTQGFFKKPNPPGFFWVLLGFFVQNWVFLGKIGFFLGKSHFLTKISCGVLSIPKSII